MRAAASLIAICALNALLASPARPMDPPEPDDEHASEQLAQSLEYFSSHPVNLGHATLQELSAIPLLYPTEALRLARYLRTHHGLTDPGMLVRDSVIAQQTLDDILPYICVDQPGRPGRPQLELRALARATRPPYSTEPSGGYPGPSWASTQKVRLRPAERWELTALTQKDPGERSIADFYSAGAAYRSAGPLRQAVLGDYQLSFGQGLLFGGSSPTFLSAQYIGRFTANAARIVPNVSTSEWCFLRGAAATVAAGDGLTVTGFGSAKQRDGSLDSLGKLGALDNTGYHRTPGELERRGAIRERLGGLRLESAVTGGLQLGLTGYGLSYAPDRTGQRGWQAGVGFDGSLTTADGQLFLEAAVPQARQPAVVAGAQLASGVSRSFIMLRQYGTTYTAPRFNAVASYGGEDEQGATIGSSVALPWQLSAAAIYDQARPLSEAGRLDRGHVRTRIESLVSNASVPGLRLEWRWRRSDGEGGIGDSSRVVRRTASRLGLRWLAGGPLTVTARYEVCRVREDGAAEAPRGDLLTVGAGAGPWRGVRVAVATAFFTTASYDARLYATEPELSGTGSFHAYYGSGRRDALLLTCAVKGLLNVEAKIARQVRSYLGAVERQTEGGLALTMNL